jgi:L-lactate dehydrogenase complex protein LldG
MSSRDVILGRIRSGLSGTASPELPPTHPVWPCEHPSPAQMADRFAAELQAVHGEVIRAAGAEDARAKLAELVRKENWTRLGVMDRPGCRDLVAPLADRVAWPQDDWTPTTMADLSASILEPDCLLADTGSSMIACATAQERLLCYLPPACVILAPVARLVEHLPAAWGSVARRAADPQTRGEFVFITGPSRTADIEKILILGVHGPKRLIVLLVG